MEIKTVIADKQLKAKAKVEVISKILSEGKMNIPAFIDFVKSLKSKDKGTCMEGLEFVTKTNPAFASPAILEFATAALTDDAPRVKWESARVIGNIAHQYPGKLDKAIVHLLTNTEHAGTVVRWSAAFALGEIVKMKTKRNNDLLPVIEAIIKREANHAIKKIYLAALKKVT